VEFDSKLSSFDNTFCIVCPSCPIATRSSRIAGSSFLEESVSAVCKNDGLVGWEGGSIFYYNLNDAPVQSDRQVLVIQLSLSLLAGLILNFEALFALVTIRPKRAIPG